MLTDAQIQEGRAKKGENIIISTSKYVSIHIWIKAHFGKASKCEFCNTESSKRYEWALRNGYEYEKNIDNYIQLCPSCHRRYDFKNRPHKNTNSRKGSFGSTNDVEVIQCDTEGNELCRYNSIKEAQRKTGVIRTAIANVLSGRAKTAGGFIWNKSALTKSKL